MLTKACRGGFPWSCACTSNVTYYQCMRKAMGLSALCCAVQWMLPRPTDIMSLRLDNTERQTVELSDAVLSSTRYMASWLRQRSWTLPQNRRAHHAKHIPEQVWCGHHNRVHARPRLRRVEHAAAIHSLKHSNASNMCGRPAG